MTAGDMFAVNHVARRKAALVARFDVCRRVRVCFNLSALIRRVFRQIAVFAALVRLDGHQVHIARKCHRRIDRQPVARHRRPIDERSAWQIDARRLHLLIDLHDGMLTV